MIRASKRDFVLFLRKNSLWSSPIEDAFLWNRRAAIACAELGPLAEPALPVLAQAAKNSQAPEVVMDALEKMFPKSADVLTNLLATGDSLVRTKAAAILVAGFAYPQLVLPTFTALTNALLSSDLNAQVSALSALSHSRTQNDLILPVLLRTLSDSSLHPTVRALAAAGLGDWGSHLEVTMPALTKTLSDSDATVRQAVVTSLRGVGVATHDPDAVIGAVLQALEDPDATVRSEAAIDLGQLGKDSRQRDRIVTALVKALADWSEDVALAAANSLARLGAGDQPGVAELLKSVQEEGSSNTQQAVQRGRYSSPVER